MYIYLGIKDEIKILIIILYYFYLGIKHNVYSKLFKKQEEIKNFSLDKIKKEIENVIQNKNCENIRFYNFICYDFPEIDYRILKLNKYKISFLNIEQLLQISILYYQYYLYSNYKKTYILNFENSKIIIYQFSNKIISNFLCSNFIKISIGDDYNSDKINLGDDDEEEEEDKKEKKTKDNHMLNLENYEKLKYITFTSVHKPKTFIHKKMNRQINTKSYNIENEYEGKPKINVIKNHKKTNNTRKNQNIKKKRK